MNNPDYIVTLIRTKGWHRSGAKWATKSGAKRATKIWHD